MKALNGLSIAGRFKDIIKLMTEIEKLFVFQLTCLKSHYYLMMGENWNGSSWLSIRGRVDTRRS